MLFALKSPFDQRLITLLGYAGILPMAICLTFLETWWGLPLLKAYSLGIIAFLAGNWWTTALLQRTVSRANEERATRDLIDRCSAALASFSGS